MSGASCFSSVNPRQTLAMLPAKSAAGDLLQATQLLAFGHGEVREGGREEGT